jgi:antitoxin ParD1/3/4
MEMQLPKELQELIQELVDNGTYLAPEEVIHDALWLLRDRYLLYKVKREELRALLDVGIQQAERGELIEGELVFAKLKEKIAKRGGQAP